MDAGSSLTSIDNDDKLVSISKSYFGDDPRVRFIAGTGKELILKTPANSIELTFADNWPVKYNHLQEILLL